MPRFSNASQKRLETCHGLLQMLFNKVIESRDCTILCGHRGKEEQEQAFLRGASKVHYPHSKHNTNPSVAVDVMPYPVNWSSSPENLKNIDEFADYVKQVADELDIPVDWEWRRHNSWDKPHYQLRLNTNQVIER